MIRWMDWTMQQLNIPASDRPDQDWVEATGFAPQQQQQQQQQQLTEDQFKAKLPQQVGWSALKNYLCCCRGGSVISVTRLFTKTRRMGRHHL